MQKKIKIEIWSDIVCPFCYIGKRRLEKALENFSERDQVEIEWRSFQLDPDLISQPETNVYTYLATRYGRDLEWSRQMHSNVVLMAAEMGLNYRFDIAKVANSFDAHRLEHLARKHNKANELNELLFKAYFTEGKNIADHETLLSIGTEAGIETNDIESLFKGSDFGDAVRQDIVEAQRLGIKGVPFFVFNRKYGISGAQPVENFLQTLLKLYGELE